MAKKPRTPRNDDSVAKREDRQRPAKGGDRSKATIERDHSPIPKDAEEEELEKLVFGDISGFKAGLGIPPDSRADGDDFSDASSHTVDAEDGPGEDLRALRDDEVGALPPHLRSCSSGD